MTRRSFLKKMLYSCLGLLGLSGSGYYYARHIEPGMLRKQRYVLKHPKIPASFNQLNIVQFSDLHLGFNYNLEQFRELTKKIQEETPDLILFTGDLVDEPQTYHFSGELPAILKGLHAPLGKYWIYGNHDHGGYGTDTIKNIMTDGGFTLLKNDVKSIEKNGEEILLAGLDDIMLGAPNIPGTLGKLDVEKFTILLVHEPDIADDIKDYPVDVQLSGHSHGGQVRFPLIGSLITPPYGEKYVEGKHLLGDHMTLYVSRGIGTTRMPYRFLCQPEFSVFTLQNNTP
nr:metallophosphoesterase [Halobacillus massiliensis]